MSKSFKMDDADILKEYREAKSPSKQIKILAEQNLVSTKVMKQFIFSKLGTIPKAPVKKSRTVFWTANNVEAVRSMVAQSMSDSEIAEQLGVSASGVRQLRYAHGIPIGKYEKNKRA